MTDKRQSDALHLADIADDGAWTFVIGVRKEIAAELRRQHIELETLRTGYEAARLEIESLKSQSAAQRWNPMENGNSETALQMAAVIAHRDAALPDEQVAFERHYRHLDLSRERDAWGNLRYTHDAVSLAWESWQVRASHGQAPINLNCKSEQKRLATLWGFVPAQAAPAAVAGPSEAVAYLDIGTGGYLDLGTDLSDEAVSRLPKGRHALVIAGTYGIDGYTAALTTPQVPQQSWIGNSGFDHKTAADFLTGKTVSDEAMRKFVTASRWAHDDRTGLQATLLSVRHELASREAEIALLKTELMDAEAAPQQEAQEPVAGQCRFPGAVWSECSPEHVRMVLANPEEWKRYEVRYLYTAPQPSPAAQGDALDAACWYWLAAYLVGPRADFDDAIVASETVDYLRNLVDAARAAREGQEP